MDIASFLLGLQAALTDSGDGPVSQKKTRMEEGAFTTSESALGRRYINHHLGETPDFVAVFLAETTEEINPETRPFVSAVGLRSGLCNKVDEFVSYGFSCFLGKYDSHNIGIDESIADSATDLFSPRIWCNESMIRVGTDRTDYGYQFLPNSEYRWIAYTGLGNIVKGSAADIRYVTFMSEDGSFEYGKKAVAVGDDCADPIKRNVFSTPTKESTVQYNYTHYGWANVPNGGADTNWNKNILADKTVYANFSAAVRYYTITFLDGDSLIESKPCSYGSIPTINPPVKSGYTFDGWEPALTEVTGDATYTAKWIAKPDFNSLSWSQIASYANSGEASKYFDLGAKKTFSMMQFTGSTSVATTVTAEIVGIDHDDLADGTGKAGLTLRLINMMQRSQSFQSGTTSEKNKLMWDEVNIRQTLHDLPTYSTFTFPSDLYAVMKKVKKKFYDHVDKAYNVSDDLFFLPSASELGFPVYEEEGTCYGLFTANKNTSDAYEDVRVICAEINDYGRIWTRTRKDLNGNTYCVDSYGKLGSANQSSSSGVYAFAYICIG